MSSYAYGFYYNITYNFGTLTQQEINTNALKIRDLLQPLGWTDNAIAGLLANIQSEGIFNPGQCENSGGRVPYSDYEPNYPYGLGLCQWTKSYGEPNKLMKYANDNSTVWYDGTIQCELINTGSGYFINIDFPNEFPYSFNAFKHWSGSPYEAAIGWLYNYERPQGIYDNPEETKRVRGNRGLAWYEYITSHPYEPTVDEKLLVTILATRKKKWKGVKIVL